MTNIKISDSDALNFHSQGKPGKLSVMATKPLDTQRDLSLAYSPGVAIPCKAIKENPLAAYEYTSKGNFVAVISNGTAVLGLGNLGPLASKPVMEGKSVLFKRFADIDSIDVEVDTEDAEEMINTIAKIANTWGGINLEDVKAPECFIIENRLKEICDIPVFHDDQHGTAIITLAALINAAEITNRKLSDMKIVANGAGSAGIACIELLKNAGVKDITLCDTRGIIYKNRKEGMNPWKEKHAVEGTGGSLEDAIQDADVFLGVSVKGALTKDMVKKMAKNPIIMAMANPDPEITPDEAREARPDAIIATGRSDYPNQVNNVMGFPYIFRGALDVRARAINEEMKIAAAHSIADLAKEPVPEEVSNAYAGKEMKFGRDYLIPVPFDPRLMTKVSSAVAKSAMKTGVARKQIENIDEYERQLASRLNPIVNKMAFAVQRIQNNPQKVIFSEGEDVSIIKSALAWREKEMGDIVLVGREDKILNTFDELGIVDHQGIEIQNSITSKKNDKYIDYLYERLKRKGFLKRDIIRLVKNDRNIFASCMLALGDGDLMITGTTRTYNDSLNDVLLAIPTNEKEKTFAMSIAINQTNTIFLGDTSVTDLPNAEEMAQIAIQMANTARPFVDVPRVAFLSFSNFGNPNKEKSQELRRAVEILDSMNIDFEYEGEMSADVALNYNLMQELYPFSRLSGAANILVMPGLHSANIASKLLHELQYGAIIGPVLSGLSKPVQIANLGSTVSEITNLAVFAALDAISKKKSI